MKVYINTILDGFDVEKINLWDHPTKRDKIVAKCINNEPVYIIDSFTTRDGVKYLQVRTFSNVDGCLDGWCSSACVRKEASEAIVQPSSSEMVEHLLPDIKPGLIQRIFSGKFKRRKG